MDDGARVSPALLPVGPPYAFPDPNAFGTEELVALGGDYHPDRLVAGYRAGVFACGEHEGCVCWWSPEPRAVFEPETLRISRRLARVLRGGRFAVTWDRAFRRVVAHCARDPRTAGEDEPADGGVWIVPPLKEAYEDLFARGLAHSVEVWRNGRLAGGLFGVRLGGFFAAESMYHTESDASKVALVTAVRRLFDAGVRLFDAQWPTPHLLRLGAVCLARREYLARLRGALS